MTPPSWHMYHQWTLDLSATDSYVCSCRSTKYTVVMLTMGRRTPRATGSHSEWPPCWSWLVSALSHHHWLNINRSLPGITCSSLCLEGKNQNNQHSQKTFSALLLTWLNCLPSSSKSSHQQKEKKKKGKGFQLVKQKTTCMLLTTYTMIPLDHILHSLCLQLAGPLLSWGSPKNILSKLQL